MGRTIIVGMKIAWPAEMVLVFLPVLNTIVSAQDSGASPLPEACARQVTAATGRPYMFPPKGNLQLGLSAPAVASRKVPLAIWISNPTEQQAAVFTCSDLGYLFSERLDIMDEEGTRILSNWERDAQARHTSTAFEMVRCLRNEVIRIPPHSCLHGDFEKPTDDLVKNLSDIYTLPPGRYKVMIKIPDGTKRQSPEGLVVEVIP